MRYGLVGETCLNPFQGILRTQSRRVADSTEGYSFETCEKHPGIRMYHSADSIVLGALGPLVNKRFRLVIRPVAYPLLAAPETLKAQWKVGNGTCGLAPEDGEQLPRALTVWNQSMIDRLVYYVFRGAFKSF